MLSGLFPGPSSERMLRLNLADLDDEQHYGNHPESRRGFHSLLPRRSDVADTQRASPAGSPAWPAVLIRGSMAGHALRGRPGEEEIEARLALFCRDVEEAPEGEAAGAKARESSAKG